METILFFLNKKQYKQHIFFSNQLCRAKNILKNVLFFEVVWKCTDHRHTNDLFRLALATHSATIAFILSQEPEFMLKDFRHTLPALIVLDLIPLLEHIDTFPEMAVKQQHWCATRVIKTKNGMLLQTVFPKLGLSVQDWRNIALKHNIKSMPSHTIKTLLQRSILSGKDLYNIHNSFVLPELRAVHYDI